MDPIQFPSWRYHRDGRAVIVNDPAEDEALGAGWADSPAAFTAEAAIAVEPATEPESKKRRKK